MVSFLGEPDMPKDARRRKYSRDQKWRIAAATRQSWTDEQLEEEAVRLAAEVAAFLTRANPEGLPV